MKNKVGDIIIGTKVDTKGLENGLYSIDELADEFEKNTKIEVETVEPKMDVKKAEKELDKVSKRIKEIESQMGDSYEMDGVKITGLGGKVPEELSGEYDKLIDRQSELIDIIKQLKSEELENVEIIQEQNKAIQDQKEEVKEIIDFYNASDDIEVKPKLIADEGETDGFLLRLQSQLDKKGLKITKLENKISDAEEQLRINEQDLEVQQKKNAEILAQGENYRKILAIEQSGGKLTKLQEYQKELAEINNIEWAYDAVVKEMDASVMKQQSLSREIQAMRQELNITQAEYDNIVTKAEEYRNSQSKTNKLLKEQSSKIDNLGKGFDKASNKVSKIVNKIFKWGLALVGIRTVLNLITRAFNTISQYNTELGTKVEQMRLVLAVALEPVIQYIVNLLLQALSIISRIMNTLFGLNIFGRASELWSKKMANNMSSGASSAKEMKKQLAGFDEMDVLQDNDSGAGGGGGAGSSMEPWQLEEVDVSWVEKLKKYLPELLGLLAGVAGFITAIKLGLGFIKALGIGLLIAGVVIAIKGIIDYLKDPSWENFGTILEGIGIALIGLAILIGNVPLAIAGAIVLIIGLLVKNWDKVKAWIQGIANWFYEKAKAFKEKGHGFIAGIFAFIGTELEAFIKFFEIVINAVKGIFDGIIKFIKGVFSGDWKMAWEGIKQIFKSVFDLIVNIAKLTFERIVSFMKTIGVAIADFFSKAIRGAVNGVLSWVESKVNWFIDAINKVIKLINKIPGVNLSRLSRISLPRVATGAIINQPGRGVPVGGAIGGEAGREGVLPLTDRSAMEMLGREIGKWITLNANIPISIGNRQIAREVRQLMAQDDFAMNN